MKKIEWSWSSMTTLADFMSLTLAELTSITPTEVASLSDNQMEFWLKAKKSARKAEEKREAEALKQLEEARAKAKQDQERQDVLNPAFGREVNFRVTFDDKTSAEREGQKSVYRSLKGNDSAFLLVANLFYGNKAEALAIAKQIVAELEAEAKPAPVKKAS